MAAGLWARRLWNMRQVARSVSRDTGRLVGFSDAVFAITITLLILEIRPPTGDESLLHGLVALWPSYLGYALTFLFIGRSGPTTTSCSTTSVRPTGSFFS
jgi:Endosomal/lysosomal potassium channel TMEM175